MRATLDKNHVRKVAQVGVRGAIEPRLTGFRSPGIDAGVDVSASYPAAATDVVAARRWARSFFDWYNNDHYHTGLNLLTPASVHYGQAQAIQQQRQAVMAAAYAAHPRRFAGGEPVVRGAPVAVWINPPAEAGNLL